MNDPASRLAEMDVHRSRFVPYVVRPITAIAFSRNSDEKLPKGLPQPTLRLAIGRDNGQTEIWNPLGGRWVQEVVFPGGSGRSSKSIDGLVWTREPDETSGDGQPVLGQHRLFSIASSPVVTEWDLLRGQPKKKSTGNFSEVWCFAAQPRQQLGGTEEQKSQDLVAGCGDGSIVLLSTADNDLQFQRFLVRVPGKKAKCMSVTYQTQDRILAGFADSTIRIIDTRNGSVVRTMSLGHGVPPGPKGKFVWQIKCLPNGDIVSGDSSGDLVFWDGRSYSLTQRVKGHDSDCIDIVTSADGKRIFTGSLDGRIAVHHNVTNPSGRRSWAKAHHRRIHTKSEVKAMSAFDSNGMSVVVSGGSDLAPAITPLREYGKENPRGLSHLPQQMPVTSARHARLLVSWSEKTVSIWRIARQPLVDLPPESPRKLVSRISLDTDENIRGTAITDDGKILAIAIGSGVKAFQLQRRVDTETLAPRKLDVPSDLIPDGARIVRFSPDSKWLAVVNLDNEVHVARIARVASKPKHFQLLSKTAELERHHSRTTSNDAFKVYESMITRLAFSDDSSVLVASDLSGHLESWVLKGAEDLTAPAIDVAPEATKQESSDDGDDGSPFDSSDEENEVHVFYGQHWAANPAAHLLPKLDSTPLVLSFRPTPQCATSTRINGNSGTHSTGHKPHALSHELPQGPHLLWVMTAKHQMYEFDVLAGTLSDWSRKNPTSVLPEDFNKQRDRVIDVVWDTSGGRERLWMFGCNWVFMMNAKADLRATRLASKKRRRSQGAAGSVSIKKAKTSGAGDKTIAYEREGLPARALRSEGSSTVEIDLDSSSRPSKPDDHPDPDASMDDDDEGVAAADDDDHLGLVVRVKGIEEEDRHHPLHVVVNGGGASSSSSSASHDDRQWWCTFKYRPILGVVPLDGGNATTTTTTPENHELEVVIVEKPMWDVLEAVQSKK